MMKSFEKLKKPKAYSTQWVLFNENHSRREGKNSGERFSLHYADNQGNESHVVLWAEKKNRSAVRPESGGGGQSAYGPLNGKKNRKENRLNLKSRTSPIRLARIIKHSPWFWQFVFSPLQSVVVFSRVHVNVHR